MDSMEPEQTPFAAVSAHTSRLSRVSLRLIPDFFESRERAGGWAGADKEINSNTKLGWISQRHIPPIDGSGHLHFSRSSSSEYSSRKDGILVRLCRTLDRGEISLIKIDSGIFPGHLSSQSLPRLSTT
jgi:hypothetical protein